MLRCSYYVCVLQVITASAARRGVVFSVKTMSTNATDIPRVKTELCVSTGRGPTNVCVITTGEVGIPFYKYDIPVGAT